MKIRALPAAIGTLLLILVVFWLPMAVAAAASIVVSLVAIFIAQAGDPDDYAYAKNLIRAMDRAAAALLSWSGRYTVSAQCGDQLTRGNACAFCAVVCRILDWIQPGHCKGAAQREGLR